MVLITHKIVGDKSCGRTHGCAPTSPQPM